MGAARSASGVLERPERAAPTPATTAPASGLGSATTSAAASRNRPGSRTRPRGHAGRRELTFHVGMVPLMVFLHLPATSVAWKIAAILGCYVLAVGEAVLVRRGTGSPRLVVDLLLTVVLITSTLVLPGAGTGVPVHGTHLSGGSVDAWAAALGVFAAWAGIRSTLRAEDAPLRVSAGTAAMAAMPFLMLPSH